MEGVVDWVTRDILTRIGGIDQCVTEFIRVTNQIIPDKIFYEYAPELLPKFKLVNNIPTFIQLLGSNPEFLALNASRAVSLGAVGIDLNFGCPAKTVNRHDGGAALLKTPERIESACRAVRNAVSKEIPVSAKIRLGFDNPAHCIEIAKAVESSGVNTLTVHCRTKIDMYKAPAQWEWIQKIKDAVNLKIIVNGDITSVESFQKCKTETGCDHFMIGRGALANPFLFSKIKNAIEQKNFESELGHSKDLPEVSWQERLSILVEFYDKCIVFENHKFAVARAKQWLAQMAKVSDEARAFFDRIKVINEPHEFRAQFNKN